MSDRILKAKQRGSSSTFLIVSVVLVVLLAGGIYALRQHDKGANPKNAPVAVNHTPASSPAPASSKPAPVSKAPQPKAHKPSASKPSQKVSEPNKTPLPTTGPTDGLWTALTLALVVGSMVAYAQSFRTRLELARTRR